MSDCPRTEPVIAPSQLALSFPPGDWFFDCAWASVSVSSLGRVPFLPSSCHRTGPLPRTPRVAASLLHSVDENEGCASGVEGRKNLTRLPAPQSLAALAGSTFSKGSLQQGRLDWGLLDPTSWPPFFVDLARRYYAHEVAKRQHAVAAEGDEANSGGGGGSGGGGDDDGDVDKGSSAAGMVRGSPRARISHRGARGAVSPQSALPPRHAALAQPRLTREPTFLDAANLLGSTEVVRCL